MDKAAITATRRSMLKGTPMAALGTSLPAATALAQTAPAAAKGPKLLEVEGKAKLVVLGARTHAR